MKLLSETGCTRGQFGQGEDEDEDVDFHLPSNFSLVIFHQFNLILVQESINYFQERFP